MGGEDEAALRFIHFKGPSVGSSNVSDVNHGHGKFGGDGVVASDGVLEEVHAGCRSNKSTTQHSGGIDDAHIKSKLFRKSPSQAFGLSLGNGVGKGGVGVPCRLVFDLTFR